MLEKVCEYLYYNQKHADSKDVSDMDIPPELCLELLIAADYLDGMYSLTTDMCIANEHSMSIPRLQRRTPKQHNHMLSRKHLPSDSI